jgi:hypothetical protein
VEPELRFIYSGKKWGMNSKARYRYLFSDSGVERWYRNTAQGSRIWADICLRRLKSTLLKHAEILGIPLTGHERKLPASDLSSIIFSKIPDRNAKKE